MNRQEHILTCLTEEASEVSKEASKINRFGVNDVHPESKESHVEKLVAEFHDFLAVYQMALDELGVDFEINEKLLKRKKEKLENMIKLSKKLGTIQE
jgi:NTP pyrophosphatase (non-canonical NTP hydrolase)